MATQSAGAGGTTTSLSNTPQAKDDVFSSTEDTAILISTSPTIISLDVLSNALGGYAKALCSIDDESPASTETKRSAVADCEDPADIKYPADTRAWAFGVDTNVIGLNAISSGPGALASIKPFVGEGELARIGFPILSDLTVSGRSTSAVRMTDNTTTNNN